MIKFWTCKRAARCAKAWSCKKEEIKVEASEIGRSSSSLDRGSNRENRRVKFDAPAKKGFLKCINDIHKMFQKLFQSEIIFWNLESS